VHHELKPVASGRIKVTQLFRQENELPDGIRPQHAIEAFAEPDGMAEVDIGGMLVFLATRRIEFGGAAYTLLLLATQRDAESPFEIAAGFRLYRDEVEGRQLWLDPCAAFDELIARYGLTATVGLHRGRFIPSAVVAGGAGVLVEGGNEGVFISAFVMQRADGRVTYSWVFALDTQRYRAAARQQGS
jgi:hypothetical protein